MFESNSKVIIVDNDEAELYSLGKLFLSQGIPCHTFEYSPFSEIIPLSTVRLAFFDIKLNPAGVENEKQIYADLAGAIRQYISLDNPPYALIFWTKNKHLINGFKEFVQTRSENLPIPLLLDCIDKSVVMESPEKLKTELQRIFSDSTIRALLSFESSVERASILTISDLLKTAVSSDKWGDNTQLLGNIDAIFSKIATIVAGKHAKDNPDQAIHEALKPILNYNIESSSCWADVLTRINDKNQLVDNKVLHKLNTVFHIDQTNSTDGSTRGGVFEFGSDSIDTILGKKLKELYAEFIPFESAGAYTKSERNNFRDRSQFLLIEISAACDYANKNPRLNKYILGLKTPVIDSSKVRKQKDAILTTLPVFEFKKETFKLWVNFNYVYGLLPSDNLIGDAIFTLKDEIVNQISNRYANHVSRIGITSF